MQKIGVDSYKEDGTKNWQASGLLYLDSTATDPRNPNILYSKWDKLEYAPNKPDGQNWKHLARTYDFAKLPTDQRNWFAGNYFDVLPQKVYYLQDTKFLVINAFSTVSGYRFNSTADGEIAIPAFELHPGNNQQPENYIWSDTNGDGIRQNSEKQTADTIDYSQPYMDDNCGVWFIQGGKRPIIGGQGQVYNKEDLMNYFSPTVLNSVGSFPNYLFSEKTLMHRPSCKGDTTRQSGSESCMTAICPPKLCPKWCRPCGPDPGSSLSSIIYDKPNDIMYISGFTPHTLRTDTRELGNKLWKYINWSTANQSISWVIDLLFNINIYPNLRVSSLSMSGDYIMASEERFPNGQWL